MSLRDFGKDHTFQYLSFIDQREHTSAFAGKVLVEAIHHATHGHPLYLALAAAAVLEARVHGRNLAPSEFEKAPVSPEVVRGHQDERIGDYLLDLFLGQLSEAERDELIFCTVPRALDTATIRAVLDLQSDIKAQRRLDRYRRLMFVTTRTSDEKIVLHPVMRDLLLRKLLQSDYQRIHQRLREYFHKGAIEGNGQVAIEEAYHTLALGDPAPAIALGILAQHVNLVAWEPLLEAVTQAPTELLPDNVEQQAYDALAQAERHHYVQDGVTAVVLYRWLLAAFQGVPEEAARLQHNLGNAYSDLPGGDRQANLEQAIACYQAALHIFHSMHLDYYTQVVSRNLEIARDALQRLEQGDER